MLGRCGSRSPEGGPSRPESSQVRDGVLVCLPREDTDGEGEDRCGGQSADRWSKPGSAPVGAGAGARPTPEGLPNRDRPHAMK